MTFSGKTNDEQKIKAILMNARAMDNAYTRSGKPERGSCRKK